MQQTLDELNQRFGKAGVSGIALLGDQMRRPFATRGPLRGPADYRGLRVASYVALGLGAVGAGLGTYFLVDAFDKRSHADEVFDRCSQMALDCPETAPLYGEAKDAESAEADAFSRSRITYVAGGALLVTGVVLFLVSAPSGEAPHEEAALVPWLGPQGLGVSGRF